MTSYEKAVLAAKAISDKKGMDIRVTDISGISSLADYMVIATGSSSTHVKALCDEAEYKLSQSGAQVNHIEGYRSNSWILLDFGDVVINIFTKEARDFYSLDRLWQDGKAVEPGGAQSQEVQV